MLDENTPVMDEQVKQRNRGLSQQGMLPPLRVSGYEQYRFLGKGAFGEVWRAVDTNSGRQVAIKYYNRRGGLDWSLLTREVDKLRHLFSHRSVVQLFQVGWEADPPFFVMEYLEAGSLEDRVHKGPIPIDEALTLFREIAVGLAHAHRKGILHCDLKPGNVLIDQEGKPRLADFGQARLTNDSSPSLGTLFYMAPEQSDLKSLPDARWDIYALGAVFYCMLTGAPPYRTSVGADEVFTGATLDEKLAAYRRFLKESPRPAEHRKVPGIDGPLADIIDRCIAYDRHDRFPAVQSVVMALDQRQTKLSRRPMLVQGILGPILLVLMMAAIGYLGFHAMVGQAARELVESSRDSNRLAARSVAERLAMEMDRRFFILERESVMPLLAGWMDKSKDDPKAHEDLKRWLADKHLFWNSVLPSTTQATLWFLFDREGYQLASSPSNPNFINRYFGWRDYFHGQGQNLDESAPAPAPIKSPYRSMVFKRRGENQPWSVAFTVPIYRVPVGETPTGNGQPPQGEPIGILGMTSDLGHFTNFRGTRNQFTVLVDLRPNEQGKRGLIVEHPAFGDMQQRAKEFEPSYYQETVARTVATWKDPETGLPKGGDYLGEFNDPLDTSEKQQWLVNVEPVILPKAKGGDTGWVVLVQENVDITLQPLQGLQSKLLRGGAIALALVLIVMTGLWAYVMVVLNEAPAARWIATLRRKLGIASRGPAHPNRIDPNLPTFGIDSRPTPSADAPPDRPDPPEQPFQPKGSAHG